MTALHIACEEEHEDIVKLLLSQGADSKVYAKGYPKPKNIDVRMMTITNEYDYVIIVIISVIIYICNKMILYLLSLKVQYIYIVE